MTSRSENLSITVDSVSGVVIIVPELVVGSTDIDSVLASGDTWLVLVSTGIVVV